MLDNECMVGAGDIHRNALRQNLPDILPSRRTFLQRASFFAASMAARSTHHLFAQNPAAAPAPDYRIEIAEIDWELSPKKKIRTAAYNAQIPGPRFNLTEGKPVTIEIVNHLNRPEIVHWHGQWIPVAADG